MIKIVAKISVDSSCIEKITPSLETLVHETRKEVGCLKYELHQDLQEETQFIFFENWQTRSLWQDHMRGEALKKFNSEIEGAVTSFKLLELKEWFPEA